MSHGCVNAQPADAQWVFRWTAPVVPYDPGGGYDEYSRILAPYLEKYTGARVDIVNMPGSGGMRGAVEIFNSPSDGTYIGIIVPAFFAAFNDPWDVLWIVIFATIYQQIRQR